MKFKFFKVCFPSHSVTMIDRKSERTINIKISLEQKQFLAQNEDIFHNFERIILLQNKKKINIADITFKLLHETKPCFPGQSIFEYTYHLFIFCDMNW